MSELRLMKGNEAIAEAAIRIGCDAYFGYPITPQSEVLEYLTLANPKETTGMVVLQAESEVAAINMVFGAAGTGKKVMTSSSSPGISLKQEGISYIAGAELPCLIVNVNRAGPGLGTIQPSQSDYFQSTKGGGHGDYHLIVLAPSSVQEMADHVKLAFDLAFKYRNPAMILADGIIGQMMEKVELPEYTPRATEFDESWAITGKKGRPKNLASSLEIDPVKLEKHVEHIYEKYDRLKKEDVLFEELNTSDADLLIVAYGSSARIAQKAMDIARVKGMKVGLLRPITLFPFPTKAIEELSKKVQQVLVVEMNTGQMIEDVKLAVNGEIPVDFYGRTGGMVPSPEEVYQAIDKIKLLSL